ncbi:hypothetical protein [Methylocystis heyeri]|uniref:Uncharacterized protein n=1 Tax=Methylocystis heyeri TaxID=391905 RepID=A0A6B8KEK3_9HYPH|nr:hypothetical protein [Methylocystis heyeri]QGM45008.1 hypothetical protein H2LOC_004505 [Methylocystis heyeri]
MADDIDQFFAAAAHRPPPGFAARVAALALDYRQAPAPLPLWQRALLAVGALGGALFAGEFVLFAFVAAVAR